MGILFTSQKTLRFRTLFLEKALFVVFSFRKIDKLFFANDQMVQIRNCTSLDMGILTRKEQAG